ncbi:hypothetical protein B0H17DRAFT_1065321 [Mycena rosella]|uniref:Uncharacterized protein n=1 Tax=Mycena rosella TaxID=1033263 RepID=A0AAD7DHC0_MYCRO|nr:hypothetical protein B0H17DRAFT_1065321 [Mycena rosella]
MEHLSTPALPPELERQIFEICALFRPVWIPKLMLIAWRVKQWCSARDTELPVFTFDILLSVIQRKPDIFFRNTLRNLYLDDSSVDNLPAILSACTGVENIWIDGARELSEATLSLFEYVTVRHLYADAQPFCTPETCPSLSFFVSLTRYPRALRRDVRFVVVCHYRFTENWLLGIKTGLDYWSRAEAFIAQRQIAQRGGEIYPRRFEIVE